VGPDGALWFTEHAGDKIGRMTLSGVMTEYKVPTPSSEPMVIEPGPDGALWFTEFNSNKIGRITTPQ
jgi:virginiamycin B lyase